MGESPTEDLADVDARLAEVVPRLRALPADTATRVLNLLDVTVRAQESLAVEADLVARHAAEIRRLVPDADTRMRMLEIVNPPAHAYASPAAVAERLQQQRLVQEYLRGQPRRGSPESVAAAAKFAQDLAKSRAEAAARRAERLAEVRSRLAAEGLPDIPDDLLWLLVAGADAGQVARVAVDLADD